MNATYNPMQSLDLGALAQMGGSNMPASSQFLNLNTYNPGLDYANTASQSILPGVTSNLPMSNGMPGGNDPTLMQSIFGGKLADGSTINGMAPVGLGLANSLFSGWMGMKNYGLAKDQLKFTKEAFNKNFGAQANLINAQLSDRARKRAYTDPGRAMSEDEYMTKYGVKA